MAAGKSSSSPRSVADATRFTSNTPHANTKSTNKNNPSASSASASASAAASRSARSPNVSSSASLYRRGGAGAGAGVGGAASTSIPHETMEERVRRLRAAHLAAKQHSVSRMDQIIGGSRRFFDAAHKFTVMGLIGFSGIALLVTVYATADMMMYNRKRRSEFFALQKQLKEDSLEAARLAYMTGTATDEQIALVEDATAKAKEAGMALPSILSAPQAAAPAGGRDHSVGSEGSSGEDVDTQKKAGGVTGWLFGGLKKEDTTRPHEETLSTSDERWRTTSATTTAATATAGEVAGHLRDKAKVAFEQERDAQRKGGPLDQIGLDGAGATTTTTTSSGEGKKKGWLW
ncbi:hypothetical protein F5Y01DRAFT_295447 [Xylaria sp. FL0043]|nr:hypothetical protein F5Y01DRAFT_295447 [Xylaria sp. FL0043]